MPNAPQGSVREVALTFLRIGATAFGGPAAHIGVFRHELVERKKWLDDEQFLDLLGATNLIPGPNSTEMAIHLGYVRAGWRGLIAAGLCFIAPAFAIVLLLAILYVQFGATPAANALLYGIKPVIIAVVANAVYIFLPRAFKNRLLWGVGAVVVMLYFFGVDEIILLFGAGAAYVLIRRALERRASALIAFMPFASLIPLVQTFVEVSLGTLFLTFLKIGGLLYGSGYVLLAFLRGDFVETFGWITSQQLLDAVAIGQFTPGPLSSTATFIGFLVADVPGAMLATLGIFLPSFVFVAISSPLIPRMRRSKLFSALLDGVNAAAVGLMASVTVELGVAAIVDPLTVALAAASLVLLVRYKVNATYVILVGGAVGLIASVIGLVSV